MADHVHLCDYLFLAWSILKQYPRKLTVWKVETWKKGVISNLLFLAVHSPEVETKSCHQSSCLIFGWFFHQGTSHDVTQASPDCWTASPMRQNMAKSCSDVQQQTWASGCQKGKKKEPSNNHKCFRVVNKVNNCLTIWLHVKNAVYPLQKAHIYIRFVYVSVPCLWACITDI